MGKRKTASHVSARTPLRDHSRGGERTYGAGSPSPPVKGNAGTPTGRPPIKKIPRSCSHWSGCQEQPLEGRYFCGKHVARVEELGALYRGQRPPQGRGDDGNA
jgi:hypothetical protein